MVKCGKIDKPKKVVTLVQRKIYNFCKDKQITLDEFFVKIQNILYLPFIYRKRVVAGKTYPIPIGVGKFEYKQKNILIRKILFSVKFRRERKIIDRLYLELIDIFNKVSPLIRARNDYLKGLSETKANRRFLKKRK